MIDYPNPFEYEAANKFSEQDIIDFYSEDFNYSRFLRSKRNVILAGERGTGKTMTMLYSSFTVQCQKAKAEGKGIDLSLINVYIPCNTPLTHKREYQLLGEFQASVISEHFLTLSIMYSIADTLSKVEGLMEAEDEKKIDDELSFVLGMSLPPGRPLFEGLKAAIQKEVLDSQKAINKRAPDAFYEDALTFASGVVPMISAIKNVDRFKKAHFALMFDDVHNLNPHQVAALNSWIAYRDNAMFSFKLATTKVGQPSRITASRGEILEGHDYTQIDMEQPFQNRYSDFGKLARDIIRKRLVKIGVGKEPDNFFPLNPEMARELEECKFQTAEEAKKKHGAEDSKKISDFVYKYGRVAYFRRRPTKANLPPYSGLETIIHLSTGVIRNLLEPCFWMYDSVISEKRMKGEANSIIEEIPPSIQTKVILERSKKKWEAIRDGLDKSIEGCTREQARQIYQLFDNLAVLFKERLLSHPSEPRAISFTISETNSEHYRRLESLLEIARKAQILYQYTSSGKDLAKREIYYVPNRILWPDRGLDPIGQHSKVSITASNLLAAAEENRRIPFDRTETAEKDEQGALFHDSEEIANVDISG